MRRSPGSAEKFAEPLEAVRADGKIDRAVYLGIEVDQPLADTCDVRAESLGEGLNRPNLVAPIVIDGRIRIFFRLLDKHAPDRFFLLHRVRPEGAMRDGLVVAY